jgi:hypothetical protein
MGFKDWFKRAERSPLARWRHRWEEATRARDAAAVAELRSSLTSDPALGTDLEIEHEMLEGLERLIALAAELEAGRVPRIDTTHKVVGREACHFSAPATLPDDHAQASGRVLLTSTRAVFVGGAKFAAVPWHGVRDVAQVQRDLLLVRSADDGMRLRFNTYGDAMEAAALASHLRTRRPL